jgi:hypothetical protein
LSISRELHSHFPLKYLELLIDPAGFNLAVRRQFIDQVWQQARQLSARRIGRDAGFARELAQKIVPKALLDLIRCDGQILARAHPRVHNVAESVLLECLDKTSQSPHAAILSEQTRDSVQQRVLCRLSTHHPADCLSQLIHESHS